MRVLALLLLLALTFAVQAVSITVSVAPSSLLCTTDPKVQRVYLLTVADEVAFITQTYQLLLQREPDSGGLAFYSAALKAKSITRELFLATVEGSAEFKGLHP